MSSAEDIMDDTPDDILAWLLQPVGINTFLSEYWEKKVLHCKSTQTGRFSKLLSLTRLDEITGTFGLRTPDIRLVKHKEDIPVSKYTFKDNRIDAMRVGRLFAEGATIIYNALQDRDEPIRQLCAQLAERTSMRTQANIYLTPPVNQGFQAHWDTHDVYILQIEGQKKWRIYETRKDFALPHQRFKPDQIEPGEVEQEFILRQGELLYIPRGVMHSAESIDSVSLHVTIGIIAYSWSDFFTDCVHELAENEPQWRQNLPLGFGYKPTPDGFVQLTELIREKLNAFTRAAQTTEVLSERLYAAAEAHRPQVSDHLRQALGAQNLKPTDKVKIRPFQTCQIIRVGDRVLVQYGARELSFPVAAERLLQLLLYEKTGLDLGELNDGLDWEGRRTVAARLVREGILFRLSR